MIKYESIKFKSVERIGIIFREKQLNFYLKYNKIWAVWY